MAEDAAAAAELARARSLAPDYEDVWRLELAVLSRLPADTRLIALRDEAARRFPDSDWWRVADKAAAPDAPRTELAAGGAHDSLSTTAPDWTSLFVQLTRRRGSGAAVYASLTEEQRFGRTDLVLTGGGGWRLAERWSAGFDLGLTKDADFMPKAAVTAWAARALPHGWDAEVRWRQRNYVATDVMAVAGVLGRYFGRFRTAYTLDVSKLDGDTSSANHTVALSYYLSERTHLDLHLNTGEEAEAVDADSVLKTDVEGVSLGARHALLGDWWMSWRLGAHRQGDFYTRRYVALSFSTGI
jgi:YaiO family outer membrane protein